jgi:threonine dehydrogenase-like Zn-dependent dehydrogenase
VVLEKDPYRAEFARSYCANQVYENLPYEKDETVTAYSLRMSKHIMENTLGLYRGFDVCIEASGAFECMQMGINLCKPNGTCESPKTVWGSRLKLINGEDVQVGMYRGAHPQIPMIQICVKQLNVKGMICLLRVLESNC